MTKLELKTSEKNPNIRVSDYENLFVGFEMECSEVQPQRASEILGLEYDPRHNRGSTTKIVKGQSGDLKYEIPIKVDKYKEANIVVEVYPDGTVPTEIVTRPVQFKKLGEVKKVFELMKDNGADFNANGRAGMHMTFLIDPHKEFSNFDKVVAQNVVQLTRAFYPEIVKLFPGNTERKRTRPMEYRRIPTQSDMMGLNMEHYTGISIRKDNNGNIWSVEVRMPDGTNDWDLIEKQVRFWMALFRQAAIIGRYGLVEFDQATWDVNKDFFINHRSRNSSVRGKGNTSALLKLLDTSLRYYGYMSEEENEAEYELKSKMMEMIISGASMEKMKEVLSVKADDTVMRRVKEIVGGK